MMLGMLLARAGVAVIVLEKHGDFLRDFRGDTIHPSTLELLHELGILEEFLRLPHQRLAVGECQALQSIYKEYKVFKAKWVDIRPHLTLPVS